MDGFFERAGGEEKKRERGLTLCENGFGRLNNVSSF